LTKKIALIRGDGTGPELVDAMLTVLNAVGTKAEIVTCDAGLEWWQKHGGPSFIPPETWQILKSADACYKGPTTTLPTPDTPRSVAVSIRQFFDLYANIRPIKTLPNRVGPLGEVDFVCVREATEGLYTGLEHRLSDDCAISIRKITRKACTRISKYAFEMAREKGWNKVIAINKGNILKETDGFFLKIVEDVGNGYQEIEWEPYFIDNFSQQLVKNPQRFNQNIVMSTNLFMDVISEEASGLVGSIGCIYSANIGEKYAMFEPAHGSAPKYKGMNKVNPTATILSGAWMLEYIGEKELADSIFKATFDIIAEGKHVTYDLNGRETTSGMAGSIAEKAKSILASS
jgi:isocitrate dehydrogenase (NAD+)